MPINVVFTTDEESQVDMPLGGGSLTHLVRSDAEVFLEAKHLRIDFYGLKEFERDRLSRPKPLILWMYDFIGKIEYTLGESFFWEFTYYRAGPRSNTLWFLKIKDSHDVIVHKNWTLAFETMFGDLIIKRGPATPEDPMYVGTGAFGFKDPTGTQTRIFQAIKEYIRLRNFRLNREQK